MLKLGDFEKYAFENINKNMLKLGDFEKYAFGKLNKNMP